MFYFALRNNATSGKISASSGANFSIRVINNPVDKIQILLLKKVKEMRIVVASEWIELEQLLNKRKKAEKTTDTHIWICYLVFVTGLQFLMFLILWIVVYCCFCWKKKCFFVISNLFHWRISEETIILFEFPMMFCNYIIWHSLVDVLKFFLL